MRVLAGLAMTSLAMSVVLLGGCRQSDEAVKAKLRTDMMQRCTTDIAPQAASVPGFDAANFCTCVTDKAIGDRSVAELKTLFEDKEGTAAQGRRAGTECLNQQLPAATATAVPGQAVQPAAEPANAAAPAAAAGADAAEDEPADTNEEEAVEDSQ
jgi:hypothetical protein